MTRPESQPASARGLKIPRGAFDRLIVGMNALGSIWILLLILLVTSDALARSFLNHPIVGVTELIQISIVGIIFSQLADAIRNRKLTRADSLLSAVAARRPRAAHAMEAVFCLLGAIYAGLAVWGSTPLLFEAIERGSYLGNEGVFTVIVWPVKAITVVGLSVCAIEFLRQARAALRRASNQ
jgi:TRAP-type mannitol/chloroaromatic compound transport system permease small subunit